MLEDTILSIYQLLIDGGVGWEAVFGVTVLGLVDVDF